MAAGVALVTGASAGLGRRYALSLAERGHPLLLVARREDRLRALAEEVTARQAVPARVLACDLATDAGLAACRAAMDASPPEVAVLNAGFGSLGPLHTLDREREDRMVRLNCLAVLDLARHALPPMVERGRGDVVILSSAAAWQPVPHMATYAATKVFDLYLAEALAEEVRGHGVRVVAVCPGPTRTEFSDVLSREGARPGPTDWPWVMPSEDPADVVAATWAALDAGRATVATGAVARGTRIAARLVPRRVVLGVAGALHRRREARAGAGDRDPV